MCVGESNRDEGRGGYAERWGTHAILDNLRLYSEHN